jgi:hypothetical protein
MPLPASWHKLCRLAGWHCDKHQNSCAHNDACVSSVASASAILLQRCMCLQSSHWYAEDSCQHSPAAVSELFGHLVRAALQCLLLAVPAHTVSKDHACSDTTAQGAPTFSAQSVHGTESTTCQPLQIHPALQFNHTAVQAALP